MCLSVCVSVCVSESVCVGHQFKREEGDEEVKSVCVCVTAPVQQEGCDE